MSYSPGYLGDSRWVRLRRPSDLHRRSLSGLGVSGRLNDPRRFHDTTDLTCKQQYNGDELDQKQHCVELCYNTAFSVPPRPFHMSTASCPRLDASCALSSVLCLLLVPCQLAVAWWPNWQMKTERDMWTSTP